MTETVTLYVWSGCKLCPDIASYFTEHRMGTVVYVGQGNDGDFEKVSPKRTVPAISVTNSSGQIIKKTVGCSNVMTELNSMNGPQTQDVNNVLQLLLSPNQEVQSVAMYELGALESSNPILWKKIMSSNIETVNRYNPGLAQIMQSYQ